MSPVTSAVLESPSAGVAAVTVRVCDDTDELAWERFVVNSAQASFFHRYGWRRVITRAFGHRAHYLIAERGGTICGVLPLFHVRSLLFGNALISVPFCVYGGVASADPEAVTHLIDRAMQLAGDLSVDYLELRNETPQNPCWPTKDLYVTFKKEISSVDEENLSAVPRKQRAMIRKGIKAGLDCHVDDDIDVLYDMYSQSVRNLGTPVFSKRYLELLKAEFGDDCEVTIVSSDSRPVAGVMSFYFRDHVLPYYGGGTSEARVLCANDFLYWQVMCQAAQRSVRVFDYGRSKVDTGSYRFKKHWGFSPEPLYYEYGLVRATAMPNLSPTNPKYRLFINLWKRMPLPLSRLIGPFISRNLG